MTSQTPMRTSSKVVAILTVVLGGGILIGTLWSGAAPTVAASLARSEGGTLPVDGIREVELDVAAAVFTLRYDDVDEASLDVRDAGNGAWSLRDDDGTLVVESPGRSWFSWFGGARNGEATLTLPRELEGLDTAVDFGAGSFDAEGDFGALDIDAGAGSLDIRGSADSVTFALGAGRAELDLADVRTADLDVNAGRMDARLSGDAPTETRLEVNAGMLDLTLPDEAYDVTSDVSAGTLTNDLQTAAGADRTVHAEVSAGNVRLRTS